MKNGQSQVTSRMRLTSWPLSSAIYVYYLIYNTLSQIDSRNQQLPVPEVRVHVYMYFYKYFKFIKFENYHPNDRAK